MPFWKLDWFKKVRNGGQVVDLSWNSIGPKIGDEEAKEIARALIQTNTKCKWLNLGGNSIGKKGAKAIAKALESNTTLTYLLLGANGIGEEGAVAIAAMLQTNSTLTTVDLGGNNIGENGAKEIAKALQSNCTLKNLSLDLNNIDEATTELIKTMLKPENRQRRKWKWFKEVQNGGEVVNLYKRKIGDEEAKEIARALMDPNTECKTLWLSGNRIREEGAKEIAKALQSNSTLTYLHLDENSIGDEGATAIAAMLQTNATLKLVDLGNNNIGENGAKAIESALQSNCTLEDFWLAYNDIDEATMEQIKTKLKPENRHRRANADLSDWEYALFKNVLNVLNEGVFLETIDGDQVWVANLNNLGIGDDGAKVVARALAFNTKCNLLHLRGNGIGDEGATAIAAALATNSNSTLIELDLRYNEIGEATMMKIQSLLALNQSSLVFLPQRENEQHEAKESEKLAGNESAEEDEAGETAESLVKQENRQRLSKEQKGTSETLLKEKRKSIDLFKKIRDGIDGGSKVLRSNPSQLWKKRETSNTMPPAAVTEKKAVERLQREHKVLDERRNGQEEDSEIHHQREAKESDERRPLQETENPAFTTLADELQALQERETEESRQQITKEKESDLFKEVHDGGEQVDLICRNVGEEGAKEVARALADPNTKCKRLWLASNNIGDEGAKTIATTLELNVTLETLHLDDNDIGHKGAIAIAKALERNATLTELSLRLNRRSDIGEETMTKIETLLEPENRTTRAKEIAHHRGTPTEEIKARGNAALQAGKTTEVQRLTRDTPKEVHLSSSGLNDAVPEQLLNEDDRTDTGAFSVGEQMIDPPADVIVEGGQGSQNDQQQSQGSTQDKTPSSSDGNFGAESRVKLENFLYTRTSLATGQERDDGILSHPRVADPEWAWRPEAQAPYLFLSHRGPETKHEIAIPTHWFLVHKLKVKCFLDINLEPSEDQIRGLLVPAYTCTHALVLISPNFRSSKYCVMELNTFMKRQYNKSLQVIPALWGINDLDGYAPAVKKTVWLTNKTGTTDPAKYMIQTLWPYLADKLDHGQGMFTSRDFAEFLSDYVRNNLIASEIPSEVAECLSRYRYTQYDSRLHYVLAKECDNHLDQREKLAILSIPDYREFYLELYLEFLSMIKAHEVLVGPVSEAEFGNDTRVNVLYGKGLEYVKGTYVGQVVVSCKSLLEICDHQERDSKWRFAYLIGSNASEFHRHEAVSRVIDFVTGPTNDKLTSLETMADQFSRLVIRYCQSRSSHGESTRTPAIRKFIAHCSCTSDFLSQAENPTIKEEAAIVASAAMSCIMKPPGSSVLEDKMCASADFSLPIALVATCAQMPYNSVRALSRISEQSSELHGDDEVEVELVGSRGQNFRVSNEKPTDECMESGPKKSDEFLTISRTEYEMMRKRIENVERKQKSLGKPSESRMTGRGYGGDGQVQTYMEWTSSSEGKKLINELRRQVATMEEAIKAVIAEMTLRDEQNQADTEEVRYRLDDLESGKARVTRQLQDVQETGSNNEEKIHAIMEEFLLRDEEIRAEINALGRRIDEQQIKKNEQIQGTNTYFDTALTRQDREL